ncbi:MAG: hypothetical protein CW691_05220 [Candidatus Bathyarchaeum sp.]|nr:MAG: hypothetical protein CW691_05220 [Candidatus Bathyarchaeum sp.]
MTFYIFLRESEKSHLFKNLSFFGYIIDKVAKKAPRANKRLKKTPLQKSSDKREKSNPKPKKRTKQESRMDF